MAEVVDTLEAKIDVERLKQLLEWAHELRTLSTIEEKLEMLLTTVRDTELRDGEFEYLKQQIQEVFVEEYHKGFARGCKTVQEIYKDK